MKIRETCGPKEEPKVIKLGDLGMGDVFKLVDSSNRAFMKSSFCLTSGYICVVALSTGATFTWDKATVISRVYPNAELILEGC